MRVTLPLPWREGTKTEVRKGMCGNTWLTSSLAKATFQDYRNRQALSNAEYIIMFECVRQCQGLPGPSPTDHRKSRTVLAPRQVFVELVSVSTLALSSVLPILIFKWPTTKPPKVLISAKKYFSKP